eukprot:COSAG02_NODE_1335_length_13197_cov_5.830279_8_plen_113_part_00
MQPDTGVEDTDSNRLTATFTLAVEQVRRPLRALLACHRRPLTCAVGAAQVSKLQLGKNKTITAFFDSCVVIHANFEPYAISLLAEPNANIGLVTALVPDIKEFLEPIRSSQR